MLYLVTNKFVNHSNKILELRNEKLEVIQIKDKIDSIYEVGNFVKVDEINRRNIIDCKVIKPDNYLDFYHHGEFNSHYLRAEIENYVNKIENEELNLIISDLLKEEDFFLFPAAKTIHHAHIGGLAEHTLSMLKLSDAFIQNYNLDRSLIYSGIIIHDYGKIKELESFGLSYTVEGNLLGHLMIGYEFIVSTMLKYAIEETEYTMLLKHIILSHHGRLDYGSPKEPMSIESYVIAQIDEVDAKINLLENSLKNVNPGTMSNPLNMFDRRRFYKMKEK